MADQKETTDKPGSPEHDTTKNIIEVFQEAIQVSSLAHYARVQAHEAEIRARHAMSLAERAICEAESVHQVAESLTYTARAIAKMALDLTNNKETNTQNQTDVLTELNKTMVSPESINVFRHFTKKSPKQTSPRNKYSDCDSSSGVFLASTSIQPGSEQKNTSPSPTKFTEPFPEQISAVENSDGGTKPDLSKEFDSSHSLPIVWENSYQGQKEVKPMPWSEKKTLRKIQRKLREIEVGEDGGEEKSAIRGAQGAGPIEKQLPTTSTTADAKSPISKEKLVSSVRFSEEHATMYNYRDDEEDNF